MPCILLSHDSYSLASSEPQSSHELLGGNRAKPLFVLIFDSTHFPRTLVVKQSKQLKRGCHDEGLTCLTSTRIKARISRAHIMMTKPLQSNVMIRSPSAGYAAW